MLMRKILVAVTSGLLPIVRTARTIASYFGDLSSSLSALEIYTSIIPNKRI